MNRHKTVLMWLVIAALVSVVAALVTVMLKSSLGTPTAEAVLAAGGAFAATFGLSLGIMGAFRGKP